MCKESAASSYSLDCELFVGLRSLKVGVLVAVTVLQVAAMLWTHWACEPHYSQQFTSLLTLKGVFTSSLPTSVHLP